MDLPAEVVIHNTQLGMKGGRGRLLKICPEGYYEVNIALGEKLHRALLPVSGTVLIAKQAEETTATVTEVER